MVLVLYVKPRLALLGFDLRMVDTANCRSWRTFVQMAKKFVDGLVAALSFTSDLEDCVSTDDHG